MKTVPSLEQQESDVSSREDVIRLAVRDPLPGPLSVAFGGESETVRSFTVRPMMAGDWILLRELGSSLIVGRESDSLGDSELVELCYLFTRPARECRAILAKGRKEFTEQANETIADVLSPGDLSQLVAAVFKQVKSASDTMMKFSSGDKDSKTVFPEPPESAAMAGG